MVVTIHPLQQFEDTLLGLINISTTKIYNNTITQYLPARLIQAQRCSKLISISLFIIINNYHQ